MRVVTWTKSRRLSFRLYEGYIILGEAERESRGGKWYPEDRVAVTRDELLLILQLTEPKAAKKKAQP
ncbi:MAG TPA: hypothetical protein VNL17_14605 [Verrucomicrobiae bacterium]|nr:hypothetical protein [Verrucomicrobiae bacterium]